MASAFSCPHPSRARQEARQELTCCVCLSHTTSFTPCSHPLCNSCWDMLPKLLCPMCRRELPGSAGAVPAWFAKRDLEGGGIGVSLPPVKHKSRAGSMPAGPRPLRRPHTSTTSSLDLSAFVATVDLSLLPRRISKTILAMSRREGKEQGVVAVLDCANTVAEDASSVSTSEARAAVVNIRTQLSRCVAQQVAEMSLDEFVALAPRLSEAARANILVPAQVLTAVRTQVSRVSESVPDGRDHPMQVLLELEQTIAYLLVLQGYAGFAQIVDAAAPGVARQTFEVIRLASLDEMAAAIFRGFRVLEPWPAAAREATAALRIWLPARLHKLAERWAMGLDSGGPTSAAECLPVDWWVRVLSSSSARGLFEQTRLAELCSILAPRFMEEGVRTLATRSWSSSESQAVVSRELVVALMHNPLGVVLSASILVFLPAAGGLVAVPDFSLPLPSGPDSGWRSDPLSPPLSPLSPLSPERRTGGFATMRRSPSMPGSPTSSGGGSSQMRRGASPAGFDDWRGTRTAGCEGWRKSREALSRSRAST